MIKKQAIGIIVDRSGSMAGREQMAVQDFNSIVKTITENASKTKIDTEITIIDSSMPDKDQKRGGNFSCVVNEVSVRAQPYQNVEYRSTMPMRGGGTNINDAICQMIDIMECLYSNEREVLIYVLTDGADNESNNSVHTTVKKIKSKPEWIVSLRGPQSVVNAFSDLPKENFYVWNNTKEFQASTVVTAQATAQYFDDRSKGIMRNTLYTNLNATSAQVKAHMQEVTSDVLVTPVSYHCDIKTFVENKVGEELLKGAAFYQLTKTERNVQSYKQVLIRDKKTGKIYAGDWARQALGLPLNQDVTLKPGMHGHYDIFVQSTSTNRKLVGGTDLIYWRAIGEPFTTQNSKVIQKKVVDPLDEIYDGLTGYQWYRRGVEAGRNRVAASHIGNKYAVAFFNEGYEDGRKRKKLRYKR